MKISSFALFALFALVLTCGIQPATAQTAQKPADSQQASPDPNQQPSAEVEDISGMYSFTREGEFVQVNIEEGNIVTGFVSRYGDSASEKGAFLDQFFSKGSFDGKRLTFTTKPVHSVWFEFDGLLERGPGKTPKEEAYRIIRGKLTQYTNDAAGKTSAKSRELEMKSFPQDFEEESATPPKNE